MGEVIASVKGKSQLGSSEPAVDGIVSGQLALPERQSVITVVTSPEGGFGPVPDLMPLEY